MKIRTNSSNNKSSTNIARSYESRKPSTYTKVNECNDLKLTEKQLATFSESDKIIIGEDFNSRIGTMQTF